MRQVQYMVNSIPRIRIQNHTSTRTPKMCQDASSLMLTMSRSIQNASSSMRIKQFVLYIDPPALRLTCMSEDPE